MHVETYLYSGFTCFGVVTSKPHIIQGRRTKAALLSLTCASLFVLRIAAQHSSQGLSPEKSTPSFLFNPTAGIPRICSHPLISCA
jgi:hypothetical protein